MFWKSMWWVLFGLNCAFAGLNMFFVATQGEVVNFAVMPLNLFAIFSLIKAREGWQ